MPALLAAASTTTSTTTAPIFLVPNGTLFVELVIFLIVLGIVARVILPPLQNAVSERHERVRHGLEAGEAGRSEADRLELDRRRTLDGARAEARAILESAQRDAEAKREAARRRGQAEYDVIVAGAHGSIQAERQRTIEEVSTSLETLVVEAAERIVGAPVDPVKHRAAIDRVRSELGSGEGR
jgi:F-type H+-transporting ATPase subunit b